jgi:hypothetical protein
MGFELQNQRFRKMSLMKVIVKFDSQVPEIIRFRKCDTFPPEATAFEASLLGQFRVGMPLEQPCEAIPKSLMR